MNKSTTSITIIYSIGWGEYRVPDPNGHEDATYFTDDKQDAIDTAKAIWGDDINVRIRRIDD